MGLTCPCQALHVGIHRGPGSARASFGEHGQEPGWPNGLTGGVHVGVNTPHAETVDPKLRAANRNLSIHSCGPYIQLPAMVPGPNAGVGAQSGAKAGRTLPAPVGFPGNHE